jgi:hypothetical protein
MSCWLNDAGVEPADCPSLGVAVSRGEIVGLSSGEGVGRASGEVGKLTTGEGARLTSWGSIGLVTGEGTGRTSCESVGLKAGEGVGRASSEVAGLAAGTGEGVGCTSGEPVPADKIFSFPVNSEGDEGSVGDVSLAGFTLFGSVSR